jgi:hypothetical protein
VKDVARLVTRLIRSTQGIGDSFNVSYDHSLALTEFLELLGQTVGTDLRIVAVKRKQLETRGLLPDCSPFSGRWMSELDSSPCVSTFGCEFSAPATYLPSIVADYRDRWIANAIIPDSYRQRKAELDFLRLRA